LSRKKLCYDAVGWVTKQDISDPALYSESLLRRLSITVEKIGQLNKNWMYYCQISLLMHGLLLSFSLQQLS